MASVSGREITKREPLPGSEWISILPLSFSMLVLTTSMPTPRPERSDTASLVENPGSRISARLARSSRLAASSARRSPFSTALLRITSGRMPFPSSVTSIRMWSPSWRAERQILALRDLPTASRSSGVSMPWSTAFLTKCTSGSFNASRMVLSTSVPPQSISRSTSFPIWRATSRARRLYFWNTRSTGCMRARITAFCRSLTSVSIRPTT